MAVKGSRQGDKQRILIAEDSRTQAEHLSSLLEDGGFAVEVAFDGAQGLAAARANPPSLVISDVNMPVMDGYQFCQALKADETLKHTPFMLVTSLSSPSDVVHGLEAGADNFITKPYEETTLLERVRYLLTNSALRGSSKVRAGIELDFGGKVHFITAERHQILDLLISSYAEAVRLSEEALKRGDQLRESYETIAVLHRSAEGLNKVRTEDEVAFETIQRVQDLPFCRASWILLTDDDGIVRRLRTSGLTEQQTSALTAISICACQRDLHLGILTEAVQIGDCARMGWAQSAAAKSGHASVALVGQQRVFGVLNVLAKEDRPFTASELRTLSALGNQVTAAMDRAHLNTTLELQVAARTEELRREVAVRQKAEAVAVAAAARLERAQRIGNVGSVEMNLVTQENIWSDEWYRMIGFAPRTILATFERSLAATHPDDRALLSDAHERTKRGDAVEPIEFRVVRPDGEVRWVQRHAERGLDQEGNPVSIAATFRDVTVHKRMEEEIRRSREHLTRVQTIGKIGSTEVDLRTQSAIWSDEVYRIFGIDPKSVIPGVDSFAAAVHPDDQEKLRELSLRGRNGEDVEPCEFRVVGPDGTIRWFYRQSEFVRDKAGQPISLIATMYEITARKHAEEELHRSLASLAFGQSIGHWGSIDTDLQTNDSVWSDEIYRILGLTPTAEKPSFKRILALVHPEDRELVIQTRDQMSDVAGVNAIEYRIIRPDGELRWVQRLAESIRDENGRPVRRAVTIQDITDRKRMEAELDRSREHLNRAQRLGRIGSAEVRVGESQVYWSEEMFRIFGLDPSDPPPDGEDLFAIVHPEDRDRFRELHNGTLRGVTTEPWEFRLALPDGQVRWLLRLVQNIDDNGAGSRGLLIINQDITATKRAQIDRDALEEQLRQSQKMEAVGNLTGGIAHDFNNILAVVIGNLDLLKMEIAEGTEANELVDTGIAACLKGSELTKSLLAFSRRQPLQPKRIDVNALLQNSVKMLSRTIGESIQVQLKLDEGVWEVLVDPSLLESALLNMVVNSRDAMPSGGYIIVETRNTVLDEAYAAQNAEVTAGEYAVLEVSDTGTGMSPEILRRVFEPFFTTKEKGKGTGLGLAMVFGFVKQSGGHIKIYSEVGHGTTIRVYLPRAGGSTAVADKDSKPASAAKARNEMILVVEDNPAVRRGVTKQLSSAGYRITEAEHATQAVEILESGTKIDLVFSDVIMPGGMTGADLAREAAKRWPALKVVLTSGFPEGLLENGNKLPAGVNLLSKPYRMDELFRKLREVLDG